MKRISHLIVQENKVVFTILFNNSMISSMTNWKFQPSFMNIMYMIFLIPIVAIIGGLGLKVMAILLGVKFVMNILQNFKHEKGSGKLTNEEIGEKVRCSAQTAFTEVHDMCMNLYNNFCSVLFNHSVSLSSSIPYDMRETQTGFGVFIDLPGVQKEEIQVEVQNNTVTVSGTRSCEMEEGETVLVSGRKLGDYSLSIDISESADLSGIVAKYENGVLSLYIPKKQESIQPNNKIHID